MQGPCEAADDHAPPVRNGPFTALTSDAIRELSMSFSPDLLPLVPQDQAGNPWLYLRADFELAALGRLVEAGFRGNRFVHYATNYGRPSRAAEFRHALTGGEGSIRAQGNGSLRISVDGTVVSESSGECALVQIPAGAGSVTITVIPAPDEPPTCCVEGDVLATGSDWQGRPLHGDGTWAGVHRRLDSEGPPHQAQRRTVELAVSHSDGLYSLSAPVLGRPVIACTTRPTIRSGESRSEALASSGEQETRHEVEETSPGVWSSVHRLGFQHLSVHAEGPVNVRVIADVPPVDRRGAFVCSDDQLNAIWAVSAYTLRLCMQDLMVDGIKRDRMPWAGDLALSTLANSFAFGAARVARDSVVALGEPTHGYVNGISDYSLWWLINSEFYLLHFDDPAHARREADTVDRFVERLAQHADQRGVFRPLHQKDGFVDASEGSVFVDWGVEVDPRRPYVPLQMLWYWALCSAHRVLSRSGHPNAARWWSLAARIRETLHADAWNAEDRRWSEYFGGGPASSPHSETFGILAGLTPPEHLDSAAAALGAFERAGTPFMTSFMLRALAATDSRRDAVNRVRDLWGGMLASGAKTFWEEFADGSTESFAMYDRPFGKSLCHAWSAGPAAILPEAVLGLRPVADGWREFTLDPQLGDLDWAAAVVPSRFGDIRVYADHASTSLDIPAGAALVRNGRSTFGPQTVRLERTGS